jgi:predicted permease
LRGTLVVAQFALALSVLVCTALLVRRDRDVNAMDLGYRRGGEVLIAQTEMSLSGYADVARWRESMERASEAMSSIAGVQQVAVASFVPLSIVGYVYRSVVIPGRPVTRGTEDRVLINGVGPGYFDLMGIELVAGREFNPADGPGQRAVVIVNEAFAETYFRGRPPLDQTFTLGSREVTIVGVARNGRYDYRNIDDARIPIVYHAWAQEPTRMVSLHVRTTGDPMRLADDAHAALRAVDPAITLLPMNTLLGHAEVPFSISRSAVKILGVLGTAALLLASMGLFAVVSYGVSLRTREIGIRIAVGATRQRVMSLVLRGAVRLAAIGAVAGIASAIALATVLRNRIPIIPRATLIEYAVPTLVLAACAVVAGLLPARRAASVDPSRTLRSE